MALGLGAVALLPAAAAPEPVVLDLLGGGRLALEQWRGRFVILNFWATWCVPCRLELADIDRVVAAHRGGLSAVAILAERRPDPRLLARYAAETRTPIALRFVAGGAGFPLVNSGVPTTYVLDPTGRVVLVKGGAFGPGELDAGMSRLIARRD